MCINTTLVNLVNLSPHRLCSVHGYETSGVTGNDNIILLCC